MNDTPKTIDAVTRGHLCMGCGACAGIYPDQIEMVDTPSHGRRPRLRNKEGDVADALSGALAICPGAEIVYPTRAECHGAVDELFDDWGPVLEVWEGHACDTDIRHSGSSGGLVTALALYAMERGAMSGVLHVRAREDVPYLNESVISRDRESLLRGAGSRYAPTSPCDKLHEIQNATAPHVFVGKPCDVAAVHRARRRVPALNANLGLTIGIFCAGAPSVSATFDLMQRLGVADPASVGEVRYRGLGWPGSMFVRQHGCSKPAGSLSYEEGWGDILQKKRQWRCHVCADHTGELADISVGDPWYRPVREGEPGHSLLVVRSERGRRLVRDALRAGYVKLDRRPLTVLAQSQPNLLRTRGAVWARLLTSRLLGVASPRYPGMNLFRAWRRHLNWKQKAQSLYGTAKRIYRKRLWYPEKHEELATPVVDDSIHDCVCPQRSSPTDPFPRPVPRR